LEHGLHGRIGLGVPSEWWPSGPLLKSFEAAGFTLTQLPSPPASVLSDARYLSRHASAARAALDTTALVPIVHAPPGLLAGTASSRRPALWHASPRAERLGVTIAFENLAPTYPGPERLSDTPLVLRALAHRIGSPRVGLCLDLGHAHIVAGLKHAALEHLVRPVLDSVVLFHIHDNLGARWDRRAPAGLDPLRLDLHLPPGRGTLPWADVGSLLAAHGAPLLLEVHPPNRPQPDELLSSTLDLLSPHHVATAA
jgi:sugar phosphate isomerase/epimerase